MAMDVFIKIDGIDGESQDAKHKGEIQLLSWAWAMDQGGYANQGGGQGSGKVSVKDMQFSKFIDKSTAALMKHCCNGKHIPTVLLTVRKAGGDPLEYLKIKLQDVLVSSYSNSGHSDQNDKVSEQFAMNFARYVVTYTEQGADGGAGPAVAQGWDMKKNVEHS